METAKLKKFAQFARRSLIEQVSAKLELVLTDNSAAQRESVDAIKKLKDAIKNHGAEQVIERVAYTWFNRFCALRFMDVNRFNQIGNSRYSVVSPADGQFQPEILAEAKSGHIEEEMVSDKIRQQIFALLDGKVPSRDPQGEAYRQLVVGACNYWHRAMPFLFERIDDYTELLMPDDLLSGNSILAYTREAMTPDVCGDVEVIGWLYQFYISEKKDKVFDDLKKNKKITPQNIPAATQLFTPHWIVRYLVENSLGRLWMLNRPKSKLIEQMEYYIKPDQPESDYLRINKPEEIKICDPACGSGHILTYAFDILYAIYEEEGYEPSEIPEKILTHNLYGIEIDERAGELAAFALTMKARARQRRFFRKPVQPNICVLRNIHFEENELEEYMDFIGRDLFTAPLQTTLQQFEEADNFGSLIRPAVTDVAAMLKILEAKNVSGHLFLGPTHQKVLQALQQADYLSPKYHVVIANPPYMGGKGMNPRLGAWVKENYPDSKSDLFAMFIERGLEFVEKFGYSAMVTMQSWMFLSSYETLRSKLVTQTSIESMAHMANMVMGIAFGTAATIWKIGGKADAKGAYCYVEYDDIGEENKPKKFPPHNERNRKALDQGWLFHASAADFKKIPGYPIAYWVSNVIRNLFCGEQSLEDITISDGQNITANNDQFLRNYWEVAKSKVGVDAKWRFYAKGGEYRKWWGNLNYIVDWTEEARGFYRSNNSARIIPEYLWYKIGVTWTLLSSGKTGFRILPKDATFDKTGSSIFLKNDVDFEFVIALLCSEISMFLLNIFSATIAYQIKEIRRIPVLQGYKLLGVKVNTQSLIRISKIDYDSAETSWDFTSLPLLQVARGQWPVASKEENPELKLTTGHYPLATKLSEAYTQLRTHWQSMTQEMQSLEEENNRIFIDAYSLQDELTPEVPLNEITLTCNPHYRYSNSKNAEELEALILADTIKEFISYAVGCMFGRYALDKPGLILANQGDTITEYLRQIPDPTFQADEDNVIPILDGDWFTDDISERFRKFLRVTFGEEHYEENLKFIEVALGKDIRKYFLKDFYNDHLRRYKKRPIYWLFSSPKGSFNALIYMHRYRPDTASVVLNGYLREFRTKLLSRKSQLEAVSISASASPGEKTKALKEIESLRKMIEELESYERDVLYPLATEQLEIDLDDGVKVNYQKFGPALKKIPGLEAKEE
jgi:type II restriction/modification system DNA methylase subunit YeeA